MYADDTTLQKLSNDINILYSLCNSELVKLEDWFKANRLTLNASKTKYIIFRKKSQTIDFTNLHLRIENQHIDRIGIGCKEESFKFVGIHLDEHLSWNFHVKMSKIK